MQQLPILYSFRRCPYAIRARMALVYSGQRCELREVLLKNKPSAMLDVSAKGTVPVLVLADRVIDESLDVMRWALHQNDPDNWGVNELLSQLVDSNDGDFKSQLDKYKYFDRYPEEPQLEYQRRALRFIEALERALIAGEDGRYFVTTPQLSSSDIAIFPFVRQFAFVDKQAFDQLDYPKTQQWLADLLDSELFNRVMYKQPPWSPGVTVPVYL